MGLGLWAYTHTQLVEEKKTETLLERWFNIASNKGMNKFFISEHRIAFIRLLVSARAHIVNEQYNTVCNDRPLKEGILIIIKNRMYDFAERTIFFSMFSYLFFFFIFAVCCVLYDEQTVECNLVKFLNKFFFIIFFQSYDELCFLSFNKFHQFHHKTAIDPFQSLVRVRLAAVNLQHVNELFLQIFRSKIWI